MAVSVFYCGICTAPPEYCQHGPSFKRCKPWLQENNAELFAKLYPADAATAEATEKLKDLAVAPETEGKGGKKKEAAAPEKLDALQKEQLKKDKKKQEARVLIKRIERTKRKCVIAVSGLEAF
ncbi:Translation machinery-associated protein 22, partial [Podochytrium sp. JEL0797]